MKRLVSTALAVIMLIGIIPTHVLAVHSGENQTTQHSFQGTSPAESVEFDSLCYAMTPAAEPEAQVSGNELAPLASYKTMTTSQDMLDIIKDCEGFVSTPYWDYMQWSIGYGTACGYEEDGSDVPDSYWGGITEAQGQNLLMAYLKDTAELEVNDFYESIGRQPSQQQFDAMVDFTYALGGSWTYGSRVADYLKNPTTEIDLVRALGAWCRVGGSVSGSTCSRRIREALVYLYGAYFLPYGNVSDCDLDVVVDNKLPCFKYVIFNGNGTYMINTRTDDVNYYSTETKYDSLPTPTRSGYTFAGWYRSDGSMLLEAHHVKENTKVSAKWVSLPYIDVSASKWFATPVAYCYTNRIMYGSSSTTFSPNQNATRGMLVTVLYRLAGTPSVSGSSGFSDVSSGKYYANAITWAAKNGIVSGYGDGTFKPNQNITRAEMVAILYRYAVNIAGADGSARGDLSIYKDASSIPGYAKTAFQWALAKSLISGTTSTTLSPTDKANRAQLAQVLMILDNLE